MKKKEAIKKTFGIVIPNRNDSAYLSKCISSITNQTTFPDEVIILDDNSSDNSLNVIEKYINGYNFFKLIKNKKQLGAIENSNKGLLFDCYLYWLNSLGIELDYLNNHFSIDKSLIETEPKINNLRSILNIKMKYEDF